MRIAQSWKPYERTQLVFKPVCRDSFEINQWQLLISFGKSRFNKPPTIWYQLFMTTVSVRTSQHYKRNHKHIQQKKICTNFWFTRFPSVFSIFCSVVIKIHTHKVEDRGRAYIVKYAAEPLSAGLRSTVFWSVYYVICLLYWQHAFQESFYSTNKLNYIESKQATCCVSYFLIYQLFSSVDSVIISPAISFRKKFYHISCFNISQKTMIKTKIPPVFKRNFRGTLVDHSE